MKEIMKKISSKVHFLAGLLAVILTINAVYALAQQASSANSGAPKILSISNLSANYGVHIGDKLSRKIVLEVPAPYQLSSSALPKKGTKTLGIELVEVDVTTDVQKAKTIYTMNLGYQTFISVDKPTVMQLPSEKFNLTGGMKTQSLAIPAWGFWFSPLVTGDTEVALKNMQPDFKPPLLDISAHQIRLAVFLSMLVASLVALLYLNADGHWLPFMGGAFAKAHRQLKRLAKTAAIKTQAEEKQAYVLIHQAFNHLYSANIFARDIEHFVTMRPGFKKMKAEIEQFFNDSNQSLYAVETRDSAQVIEKLVGLSKQLRDCERGV